MLHRRRTRARQLAQSEQLGQTSWTDAFAPGVRQRIYLLAEDVAGPYLRKVFDHARRLILHDEGLEYLVDRNASPDHEFEQYLRRCPDEMMPTVLEALYQGLGSIRGPRRVVGRRQYGGGSLDLRHFAGTVNDILAEYRIAFELIDGKMARLEAIEVHNTVVLPVLRLLPGRKGWEGVEASYQKALEEIGRDPADAITDAGTALQEALKLVGCKGNALGPLAASARKIGLLAPHDATLSGAIEKIVDWVAADRSMMGDAHNAAPATRDDAWLAVHVVGALILRLASGAARAQ